MRLNSPEFTLILASTSPFRRELLERLNMPFETFNPQIDEKMQDNESAPALVERLAIAKARAACSTHGSGLVIGSDQVCVNEDTILGKPGSHEKAVVQLQQASGKTIRFYTGLCLYNIQSDKYQVHVEPFDVHFRRLSNQQIENYLRAEQPYNCAGSFKSEGLGIALFDKLSGDDPNALIGLPLIQLIRMLGNEGIDVLGQAASDTTT